MSKVEAEARLKNAEADLKITEVKAKQFELHKEQFNFLRELSEKMNIPTVKNDLEKRLIETTNNFTMNDKGRIDSL